MEWVASRIPPPERDLRLSWSHYVRIAKFKLKTERKHWMDRALKEELSSRDLGIAISADTKIRAARTANSPGKRYDRFNNDRLLLKVETANNSFFKAFQAAQVQFGANRTFDHAALRPPTEDLRDALNELLAALVIPRTRSTSAPSLARNGRGWSRDVAAAV